MTKNYIERLFIEDIREKKKAASGAFHKTGKGIKHGMSGALRTPYHYMKEKDRKKLSGPMEVTNMYETIIDIKDFLLKDKEMQKRLLTRWREIYDNRTIERDMAINHSALNKLIHELEIPKKPKTGGRQKRKAVAVAPITAPLPMEDSVLVTSMDERMGNSPMTILNGLNLKYNGVYDSESLSKILTKLQLLIEGEENKFTLSINIQECQE